MTNTANKVEETGSLTLLQFYAEWCYPCKMMMPVIESIKQKQYNWLNVEQVDIDAEPRISDQYCIRAVPTFIVLKNDTEVWRNSGMLTEHALVQELSLLR